MSSQTPSSILVDAPVTKLTSKNEIFTHEEKMDVVEALGDCTDMKKLKDGLNELHKILGNGKFANLSVRKVKEWRKWYKQRQNGINRKRGRKVNTEFEIDVWSELILCVLNTISTPEGEEIQ